MKELKFEKGELVLLGGDLMLDVYGVPINEKEKMRTVYDAEFLQNKLVLYFGEVFKKTVGTFHIILFENKKYYIVDNSYAVDVDTRRNIQKIEMKQ